MVRIRRVSSEKTRKTAVSDTATIPVAARLLQGPERDVVKTMEGRGKAPVQPGLYSVVGTAWRRYLLADIAEVRGRRITPAEVAAIEKALEPRREHDRRRNHARATA
jgi:hypothetical protein